MAAPPIALVERHRCPACGTTGGALLADEPLGSGPIANYLTTFYGGRLDPARFGEASYQLVECPGCSTLYQRHVPDDALLAELYDEILVHDAEDVARRRGLADRRGYADQIEALLVHLGLPPEQVRVLDHGAGYGLWLQMAAAFGCQTAAAELSTAKLDRAGDAGHETFAVDQLPEAAFHFVNSEQVFEHLIDPGPTLGHLARALRPGGILRIRVPSQGRVRDLLAAPDWTAGKDAPTSLNAVAPLEHVTAFSRRGLEALARKVDLEPFAYPLREQIRGSARVRALAGAVGRSLHLRPPAEHLFTKVTPRPTSRSRS